MEPVKSYVVINLEATCDNKNAIRREEMEIIEIGAVLVEGQSLQPVQEFQTFVKPVRHGQLTPFCTTLTTITQADVDAAPSFAEAVKTLRLFLEGTDALFCSWGNYNRNQFEQDALFHGVALPLGTRHFNLKQLFADHLHERPTGVDAALRRVGLQLLGTHHRGIDDARNITRLLPWALGRAEAPPRGPGGDSGSERKVKS